MTDHNRNINQSRRSWSGRQSGRDDPDSIPEEDTLCCCPSTCSCSWLQCLANPKVFTVHMLITTSFTMMSFVYIGAVLTTIERNFQLDSATSGSVTIASDIISTLFVIPLSHFGQMGHRPRWIGTGVLVTAVGTMLCAVPHFISDPINPKLILTGSVDQGINDICSADDDDLFYEATQSSANSSHIHDGSDDHGSSNGNLGTIWWIVLGQIISGIGNAPFVPLVITYIDDSVKKRNLTAYTAVLFIAFTLGPSCGFLFAAFTTKLYVDFDRVPSDQIPDINQNDPRWIGAWWLGFVILSVILVFLSLPIFFYPRTMSSAVKKWKDEKKEAEAEETKDLNVTSGVAVNGDDAEVDDEDDNDLRERSGSTYAHLSGNTVDTIIKGPILALKRLFCNSTNVLLVIDETAFISMIAIFAAFGVKYTETQFSLSPSEAALVTAIVLGPSNFLSNIFSAYICRRFKFNSKQCCFFVLICAAMAFILFPIGMFLGCDNIPVAGVTTRYNGLMAPSDGFSISTGCNQNCSCSSERYQPVCGSNGLTYISPCHAGCNAKSVPPNHTNVIPNPFFQQYEYSDCNCIDIDNMANDSASNLYESHDTAEASSGQCPNPNCRGPIPLAILLAAIFFLQSAKGNPTTYIALRCVREEDRSMAIALRSVCGHFIGFFPAPIYFGAIINSVCILWQTTDGEKGACWLYDNRRYRFAYFGCSMALQGIALIAVIGMYFSIKEKLRNKKRKDDGQYDNMDKNGIAIEA